MRRYVLLVLAAAVAATPAAGQTSSALPGFWVSVGAGPGAMSGIDFGAEIAAFYQTGSHLFSIRNTAVGSILGGLFGPDSTVVIGEDFGVLYGRATAPGLTHASLAAGIGVAKIERANGDVSNHLSIPVEAHIALRPIPFLGVGVTSFMNVNAEKIFGGVLLSIQAGRLR